MSPTPTTPIIHSAMPGFAVSDMERAMAFYTEKLGFRVSFRNGDVYSIVRRDAVEISLALRKMAIPGSCYLKLEGIDAIHRELALNGVAMTHDLKNEPYGMREFMITDPDGNTLNFGQTLA